MGGPEAADSASAASSALHPSSERGRPQIDESRVFCIPEGERVLDGILTKLTDALPWYDLPDEFPSWQTCYRRYHHWQRRGVLLEIQRTLFDDLMARGNIDITRAFFDGTIIYSCSNRVFMFSIHPRLKGTWQYDVVLLYARLAIKKIRQKTRFRTFGPA